MKSNQNISQLKRLVEADVRLNKAELQAKKSSKECLLIKTANQWLDEASKRPIPDRLFSEFWYENEVCILFADTNVGKSILAVQIANSISKGSPIPGFKMETKPKKVLYLDFELSDKQFEKRYSNEFRNHFEFGDNFYRAEFNLDLELPKGFSNLENYLCATLGHIIKSNGAEVVIVDNLTYLKNDNEKAKDALDLMKLLKQLSREYSLSFLVLAHTPKRDVSKPLIENDLAGSKMLSNFCDSIFCIGKSATNPKLRYLKQIKQRNVEHIYHSDNVIVCQIQKKHNFLGFSFLEYDAEYNHLTAQMPNTTLKERDEIMKNLISEGKSNVEIANELGVSEGAIRKRKKVLGLN